jgi:Lon protease-like protein
MPATTQIPLFPLGLVLLPKMILPLHIFEERYKQMISECLEEDKVFGIVLFQGSNMYSAGCTARIEKVIKTYEDGRMDIITQGQDRFVIHALSESKPYLEATVTFFDDKAEPYTDDLANKVQEGLDLLGAYHRLIENGETLTGAVTSDYKHMSFILAGIEGFSMTEKQKFLEMTSTKRRIEKSVQVLDKIMARIRLTQEIEKIISGNGHVNPSLKRSLES